MTNPPPLTNTSLWPCKMCIKTVFGAGGGGRGGGEEGRRLIQRLRWIKIDEKIQIDRIRPVRTIFDAVSFDGTISNPLNKAKILFSMLVRN